MKALYTLVLLIVANVFMTVAWYGHLKLQWNHIAAFLCLVLAVYFVFMK